MTYEDYLGLIKCSKIIKDDEISKDGIYTIGKNKKYEVVLISQDENYTDFEFKLCIILSDKFVVKLTLHVLENNEKKE